MEYVNMAKAHITKGSTKITVEGTPEEVAELVAKLTSETVSPRGLASRVKAARSGRAQKATPNNLIEGMGHFYPVTTLSPTLLRLVRRRQLRRIKDQKRWLYTG